MIEFIFNNIAVVLSGAGAVALIILTPLGKMAVERWFTIKPAFSVGSPVMDSSFLLVVTPANNAAKKRKRLGARVRGLNIVDASTLSDDVNGLHWLIDLSQVDRIHDIFKATEDYEFQFFFDASNPSEKITIRFIETEPANFANLSRSSITVKNGAELVSQISSDQDVACIGKGIDSIISRAFPTTGGNTHWANVHDGKELIISNLSNTEISGSTILAEPRYAWVLNFKNCHGIALRNMIVGHVKAGYCMGGVLRFENCSNIIIERCDLFGSGTYGLEFINCQNAEIIDVTIRECTYGGVILDTANNIVFRGCKFKENTGFDLVEIRSLFKGINFHDCTFQNNSIQGAIFLVDDAVGDSGLYVNDCVFEKNVYGALSNFPDTVSTHFNHFK